jgi:hypothetical protein
MTGGYVVIVVVVVVFFPSGRARFGEAVDSGSTLASGEVYLCRRGFLRRGIA